MDSNLLWLLLPLAVIGVAWLLLGKQAPHDDSPSTLGADSIAAETAARQEAERIAAETAARQEAERIAAETAARQEAERIAAETAARQEAERVAAETAARQEAERVAAETAARQEAERIAAETAARQEAERVAAETAARPPSLAVRPVRKPREQTIVMVADDSKIVRVKASKLLQRQQYQVWLAEDGSDAARQLADRSPDLLITDVDMPGLDGFALTRQVRQDPRTAGIPIIMITAADDRHREAAAEAGVTVLLGKPYDDAELLSHIENALEATCLHPGAAEVKGEALLS